MSETTPQRSPDFDLITWFELNRNSILAGIGLMVVALAGVIIWKHQSEKSRVDASNSLILAKLEAGEAGGPELARLEALAERHAGRPTGLQARLLAARELYTAGRFAEARQAFEEVAASDLTDLADVARLGVAACLDAEDRTADALRAYQSVIDLEDAPAIAQQARLSKARLHESLNQPEEALRVYDAMISGTATLSTSEARMRRAELLRQHPTLERPARMTNMVEVTAPASHGIELAPTPPE